MRDPRDTCEHCPAFCKTTELGKDADVLVPLFKGNDPVTENGAQVYEKGEDGRFLRQGACRLFAPKLQINGATSFPLTKSNWWCEDPERAKLIERLAKQGVPS